MPMIVAGVDRSDAVGPVVDVARRLAAALDTGLLFAHVAESPVEEGEELLRSLRERPEGAPDADARLVEGSPAERLVGLAEEEDAELLVVGSRGYGSLRSAMLGGVSRRVIQDARCPVVVVPPGASLDGPEDDQGGEGVVVCGVDGSAHALAAARLAGRLARRLGARLLVVHARQDPKALASYPGARGGTPPVTGQPDAVARQAERVVEDAVQAVDVEATGLVESGPPADLLASTANREDAALIVVAARGMSAVRAALLGSVTIALTTAAKRPVVVLSEPAELAMASG